MKFLFNTIIQTLKLLVVWYLFMHLYKLQIMNYLTICFERHRWKFMVNQVDSELYWAIKKLKGKFLVAKLLRLGWRAFIYFIRMERNQRIFRKKRRVPLQIAHLIREEVKVVFIGKKSIACDAVNRLLSDNWELNLFS